MGDSNSIVNLGELAKPANTLIEKISDAIGVVFEPHRIRRLARANADAAMINVRSNIEITEIQERALKRILHEETKRQENIENITAKALPYILEDSTPENMESDWISDFFDKAKLISDEKMQDLWAKILTGEANEQGTYSKRTLSTLSLLDKRDAVLFSKFCSFVIVFDEPTPILYDLEDDIYKLQGLYFSNLKHLESVGLINFDSLSGYVMKDVNPGMASYFDEKIELTSLEGEIKTLSIGHALFTRTGYELYKIINPEKIDGFASYIRAKWTEFGFQSGDGRQLGKD